MKLATLIFSTTYLLNSAAAVSSPKGGGAAGGTAGGTAGGAAGASAGFGAGFGAAVGGLLSSYSSRTSNSPSYPWGFHPYNSTTYNTHPYDSYFYGSPSYRSSSTCPQPPHSPPAHEPRRAGSSSGTSSGPTAYAAGLCFGLGMAAHNPGYPSDIRELGRDVTDCLIAKKLDLKPKVDCFYSWEHWHGDNELYYVIRIDPSGQNPHAWQQGILDNIKGEGGVSAGCPLGSSRYCVDNTKYNPRDMGNGTTIHGLEMATLMRKWVAGDMRRAVLQLPSRRRVAGCTWTL